MVVVIEMRIRRVMMLIVVAGLLIVLQTTSLVWAFRSRMIHTVIRLVELTVGVSSEWPRVLDPRSD